jgi:hypothetical protein
VTAPEPHSASTQLLEARTGVDVDMENILVPRKPLRN